jgi:hypothetical protein
MEISGYAKGDRYSGDIKAQRSAIRAYGRQHGLKVRHIVVEDEQAFGPVYHRDGGFLFTKKAKAGDVIIAARFGDLFCSPADALKVVAFGEPGRRAARYRHRRRHGQHLETVRDDGHRIRRGFCQSG